jgi:hypothetical protein
MKKRLSAAMLVMLVILSACKLSQSASQSATGKQTASAPTPAAIPQGQAGLQATSTPSAASSQFAYALQAASNPINLAVTLDTNDQAVGLIPLTGGQLQTTGPGGVVYTLQIPDGSLVQPTKISMTPVASLSGLPFGGGNSYAVQLAPEGLHLYQDAILTITPPQPIPVEQQVMFDYQGSGLGPGLSAPVQDSPEIKLRLIHFSGYGVTEGSFADAAAAQEQLGSDPVSRIQSLAAQVIAEERLQQESGSTGDSTLTGQMVIDLINQYEEQVVKPALQAAGNSCEAGKDAIGALTDLERTRQLLGVTNSGNFAAELMDLVSAVAKVCVQEAYQQCVDQHVIHQMIPLWIGLMREYELLGGAASGPEPEEVKLAEELTTKCLTFELQFDSQGSFDAGGGGYKSSVKAVIKLVFDPNTFTIKGEGPLESVSFEFTPPAGCTATSTPGGGTFNTISLEYITDTHSPDDQTGYVQDFKLVYWPGVTTESYHVDCPPQGTSQQEAHYTSLPSGYWSGIFFTLHTDELNAADAGNLAGVGGMPAMPDLAGMLSGAEAGALPAFPVPTVSEGSGFVLDTWNVTPGDLFATREWYKDNGGAGITESGTFKLYHKPGG